MILPMARILGVELMGFLRRRDGIRCKCNGFQTRLFEVALLIFDLCRTGLGTPNFTKMLKLFMGLP